jgi:hypothetical protein
VKRTRPVGDGDAAVVDTAEEIRWPTTPSQLPPSVPDLEIFRMDDRFNQGCIDLRFGDGLDGRRQIGGNATTCLGDVAADCRGDAHLKVSATKPDEYPDSRSRWAGSFVASSAPP